MLAWLRLLLEPQDAAAVVRALARPPIGLRQVDLARVIQVARRRKLDLVVGLAAATESPQVPPEARERIQRFVELHRRASADLDAVAPDVFLERLIERLGMPGRSLLAPEDLAEQQQSMGRLLGMARAFVGDGGSDTRELARHLATALPGPDGGEQASEEPPAGETVQDHVEAALALLREELSDGVARIGGRLGELRLDTDLDISHGVVRYLELLKVSALMQRPPGQDLAEALSDINARLLAAATPLQREILQTSTLDESLLAEGADAPPIGFREEHSLRAFLPRRGSGLAMSASDIETYRSCPLRYKFARVLRIPSEQTIHQRFGIVVHQVLERYHSDGGTTLPGLLELLDTGWRRAGFGRDGEDGELFEKARVALTTYHARLHGQDSEPVWFERAFSFRLGPHHLRGRVDRVDRLAAGGEAEYELIDYKTSRPKSTEQLRDDVQLSLYALAAREDWQLESSRQAYYYVLDDVRVPVPRDERDTDAVREIVLEVGEGILAQDFEPTPSPSACRICDYRIVCPAAEA
ncbi:MAG: ATP-dependent helicase UvrD/PcrA [Solirubrobacteraceae bacterium]|nr:ATP-dependent helicase UvrD/PcrA [Solirubrobacteraceae bacterium]